MLKNTYKIFLYIFYIFSFLNFSISQEKRYFPKCGVYDETFTPIILEGIPIEKTASSPKRGLDSEKQFKDFNIYLDLENLNIEIEQNNLTQYREIYVSSMTKAINTLTKLLKVVPFEYKYYINDEDLRDIGLKSWDKTKFGTEAFQKNGTTFYSLNIDLVIFGKIMDVNPSTLASAGARYLDSKNRPFIGMVNINKNVDYSLDKSREYLESIILHEFTHILGFTNNFFENHFHNVYWELDTYGVNRTYINSSKVLEIAKKYYNCDDIKGVALEEYGGSGTVGSHWEAKILLGDYMNGYIFTNEQVISEFTLALLEDSGFYKANYYTGGLMRYRKHKGCSFIKESCVDRENHTINPLFENEFYDQIHSDYLTDANCSSGRQSRTYYAWWLYDNLATDYPYYIYFEDQRYGGFGPADFCPVAQRMPSEESTARYTGQCNKKGNGGYGTNIYYSDYKNYTSENLQSITGETYSDHSFCFLSSLFKENIEKAEYYSSVNRAICYDIFCSEKSLTVKINEDYIVCPRSGGKIEVEGYKGFFLCPDYNLMCSGTVICNDMFECVEKESLVKNTSYYYDYEIKTSQNLDDAYINGADNITNYELSENATCPIYCKHCKENQKYVKCKNGDELVGYLDSQKVECFNESVVSNGYYKSEDNIYYPCIENCDKCNNSLQCTLCINNYIFINNNFSECILNNSIDLDFYYTNDNITYFSCKDIRYQNNEKCQELLKQQFLK